MKEATFTHLIKIYGNLQYPKAREGWGQKTYFTELGSLL